MRSPPPSSAPALGLHWQPGRRRGWRSAARRRTGNARAGGPSGDGWRTRRPPECRAGPRHRRAGSDRNRRCRDRPGSTHPPRAPRWHCSRPTRSAGPRRRRPPDSASVHFVRCLRPARVATPSGDWVMVGCLFSFFLFSWAFVNWFVCFFSLVLSMVDRWRRSSRSKSPTTAQNLSASLVSGARCWGTSYRRHRRVCYSPDDFDRALPPEHQGSAFACSDPSGVGHDCSSSAFPKARSSESAAS